MPPAATFDAGIAPTISAGGGYQSPAQGKGSFKKVRPTSPPVSPPMCLTDACQTAIQLSTRRAQWDKKGLLGRLSPSSVPPRLGLCPILQASAWDEPARALPWAGPLMEKEFSCNVDHIYACFH
jgi:hypothetical protein